MAQLLKMAESGAALQQHDALEARIRAGDANAIQFFEFAKGYASGKESLKEFEAMNKRLNPSR